MSIQVLSVFSHRPVAIPHGAGWGPGILAKPWLRQRANQALRLGRAMWSGLEAYGQARANSELDRLAERYASQPEFAQALREARRDRLPD